MNMRYARGWLAVDLDALAHNARVVRDRTRADLIAVVKADAYGLGAVPVARALQDACACFGVATVEEGIALREGGISLPIWVMGLSDPSQIEAALLYRLDLTVDTAEQARQTAQIARGMRTCARVHIALDSGMHRIGVPTDRDGAHTVAEIARTSDICVVGLFSHMMCADTHSAWNAIQQLRTESFAHDVLPHVPLHLANSAGCLIRSGYGMPIARAGLALYGVSPDSNRYGLRPVARWYARIVHLSHVRAGECVGYGATYRMRRAGVIATLSVGYADGYPRALSNIGHVVIAGHAVPVVGAVCMDMMMADVSKIASLVSVGMTAQLYGAQRAIALPTLASAADTCPYELLCRISARVPRVYDDRIGEDPIG